MKEYSRCQWMVFLPKLLRIIRIRVGRFSISMPEIGWGFIDPTQQTHIEWKHVFCRRHNGAALLYSSFVDFVSTFNVICTT